MTAAPHSRVLPFASRVRDLRGSPIGELDTLLAGHPDVITLAGGTPNPSDIPVEEISHLVTTELEADHDLLTYGLTEGDPALRSALLEFAPRTGDGLVAPDQLIVTSGAMQGIDLVAKLFLDPGDLALVESPTFSDALATFSAYGAHVAEVPTDESGMIVEAVSEIVERAGRPPKLIYVVPTFQNPTGGTTTVERREALLELNRRYGSVLIDDDPYRLLRYRGEAIPSLRSLAPAGDHVVAIRSASKLIAPGVRVGWACGPPEIVARMVMAKQGVDVCTSNINQRVVARFLSDGLFENQLPKICGANARRLAIAVSALHREFARTAVSWREPAGGYFLWVELPDGHSTADLLRLAIEEGVSFVPGSAFSPAGGFRSSLRLCFIPVDDQRLAAGISCLRAAYDRLLEGTA